MAKRRDFGKRHSEIVHLTVLPRTKWGTPRKKILIYYSMIHTPYGKMLIASVPDGICFLGCGNDKTLLLNSLQKRYPYAEIKKATLPIHQNARKFFTKSWSELEPISLCVRGTAFQGEVWQALLDIPIGNVCSYGDIAQKIGHPQSARAVGSAVGQNPIVYLIPCHRVICANGKLGGFFWGVDHKLKFLNSESDQCTKENGYSGWEPTLF